GVAVAELARFSLDHTRCTDLGNGCGQQTLCRPLSGKLATRPRAFRLESDRARRRRCASLCANPVYDWSARPATAANEVPDESSAGEDTKRLASVEHPAHSGSRAIIGAPFACNGQQVRRSPALGKLSLSGLTTGGRKSASP